MPILVHYGELALKGKNRRLFENKLIENIRKMCGGNVRRLEGRIVVENADLECLEDVFGISWFAHSYRAEKNPEAIIKIVLDKVAKEITGSPTFGVIVRRADKGFRFTSTEVAKMVGEEVKNKFNLKVHLKNPELKIHVEIADEVFIYFERIKGRGGLPVGVSGNVLCLLSGGIDSPVAAYLMMKRGCKADYIHFHSFSKNIEVLKSKIGEIVGLLSKYGFGSRLFLAPYHPFQVALLEKGISPGYEMVLFRRMMLSVAEELAKTFDYKGIVTGDSIGQVASQTLDNLQAIGEYASVPVLQPLICFDKQEITDLAKKIGTYEMSIKPYKDCCSILAPRPKTNPRMDEIKRNEERTQMKKVIRDTLDLTQAHWI
jgi:thiamine biosynthesis protein ThiI